MGVRHGREVDGVRACAGRGSRWESVWMGESQSGGPTVSVTVESRWFRKKRVCGGKGSNGRGVTASPMSLSFLYGVSVRCLGRRVVCTKTVHLFWKIVWKGLSIDVHF